MTGSHALPLDALRLGLETATPVLDLCGDLAERLVTEGGVATDPLELLDDERLDLRGRLRAGRARVGTVLDGMDATVLAERLPSSLGERMRHRTVAGGRAQYPTQ